MSLVNKRLYLECWTLAEGYTSLFTDATVTFSTAQEFGIYTSIFVIYMVSNNTT